MRVVRAFIFGAGMAYLFDPQSGKDRRRRLRGRVLALVRGHAGRATDTVPHAEGSVGGPAENHPAAGGTVKDRILSQAFSEAGVPTGDISVDVTDDMVTLHGTIASNELAQVLIERVRAVPGVRVVTPRLTLAER